PQTALHRLNDFRVLCALRKGPFGVRHVNRLIEAALADAGLIAPDTPHYAGRPVLILRNDYNLHLFNGDVGLVLPDPAADGALRAFFLMPDGALRRLLPSRLPEHETTFAMTVHKSQGSEFERVLFVLPDQENPVLTRELIYTGATRARRSLELWFSEPILRTAIARQVERTSGLRDMLWPGENSP
ncbi:MAG: ATP-binding domain-containing protein, partial [Verrucomicrobiota bacterium]|nr:ATP-binding domain-containing protein [Verrucomicrobiota bacterium]